MTDYELKHMRKPALLKLLLEQQRKIEAQERELGEKRALLAELEQKVRDLEARPVAPSGNEGMIASMSAVMQRVMESSCGEALQSQTEEVERLKDDRAVQTEVLKSCREVFQKILVGCADLSQLMDYFRKIQDETVTTLGALKEAPGIKPEESEVASDAEI